MHQRICKANINIKDQLVYLSGIQTLEYLLFNSYISKDENIHLK